jgi:hypothetical protein
MQPRSFGRELRISLIEPMTSAINSSRSSGHYWRVHVSQSRSQDLHGGDARQLLWRSLLQNLPFWITIRGHTIDPETRCQTSAPRAPSECIDTLPRTRASQPALVGAVVQVPFERLTFSAKGDVL